MSIISGEKAMILKKLSEMIRASALSAVVMLCAADMVSAQPGEMISIFGGEKIAVGDTVQVRWNIESVTAQSIVLWSVDKSSWTELGSDLSRGQNTFNWVVADEQQGLQNRIGLKGADGTVLILSRGYFSIVESGSEQSEQISAVNEGAAASVADYSLALYPNPAMNASRLSWERSISGTVRLVSQDGNVARTYHLSSQDAIDINLDGLSAGAYIVVVNSQAGVSKSTTLVVR